MNDVKRMQQLAGLIKENKHNDWEFTSDSFDNPSLWIGDEIKIEYFLEDYINDMEEEEPGFLDFFKSKNEIFKIQNSQIGWLFKLWNYDLGQDREYFLDDFNKTLKPGIEIIKKEGEDLN